MRSIAATLTLFLSLMSVLCLVLTRPLSAESVPITYQSTVSRDSQGPLDLKAEVHYDAAGGPRPIAVVMHSFSGSTGHFETYRPHAERLRDAGFFVVTVAMRGREGSDGVRDSGGVEIHDIYDAVEHIKKTYAPYVDPTNVHITGYSGGGGNAMSAVTKFPDYFRAASSYFGMSDYGVDPVNGWYQRGAGDAHKTQLRTDIGNPITGGPAVRDRYLARASNRASMNNPYTEIHLFANADETLCPPINHELFKQNAEANAAFPGEFNNITIHVGRQGLYQDFDDDGRNDPDELQYWIHNEPTANAQSAAERWYLDRVLAGAIPEPRLNAADTLYVAGFVKTRAFDLWLGDGQNAAGLLEYEIGATEMSFSLSIESSDKDATGVLKIDLGDHVGERLSVRLNGEWIETITAGNSYTHPSFGQGDTLVVSLLPEPTAACASFVMLALLHRR